MPVVVIHIYPLMVQAYYCGLHLSYLGCLSRPVSWYFFGLLREKRVQWPYIYSVDL